MKSGWEVKRLGEVATIINGGTPKSNVVDYWNGGIQWLTPKDMGKLQSRDVNSTPRTISKNGVNNSSAKLVPPGSVILSTRAPIGYLAINSVEMAFNQGCRALVPLEVMDCHYLYYFLSFSKPLLESLGTGTTFKELSGAALKNIELSLPPLEEQQRIVAILDEAFAGLESTRTNAEANLNNAEEVFRSSLTQCMDEKKAEWEVKRLGDIANVGSGNSAPQNKALFAEGHFPFVRTSDVGQVLFGTIEDSKDKLNEEGMKGLRVVRAGTLLMPKSGASTFLNHRVLLGMDACVASHLATVEAKKDKAMPRYLLYAMLLVKAQDIVQDQGYPSLNLPLIESIEIPMPPLEEQRRIVGKLDALKAETSKLKEQYRTQLADIADLRQSLLQKAFAGELT